ncbi:hypothetical protein OPQ81_000344 [Rhizoctonia solani]|nr:hypothetical protein OPQ81_000344 [Rhizoctonia solani]
MHEDTRNVTKAYLKDLFSTTQLPPHHFAIPELVEEGDFPSFSSHIESESSQTTVEVCGDTTNTINTCLCKNQGLPLFNLYTRLPCSPSDPLKTLLNNALFGDYLLAQNEKLMEHWYFRPASSHKKRLQQGIMSRLQAPLASFARWIALVGMGICEAFLTEDLSQVQLQYLWIKHIEGTLRHELLHDTTSDKIQERRSDWVHVDFSFENYGPS